jgi:hypothetical protein
MKERVKEREKNDIGKKLMQTTLDLPPVMVFFFENHRPPTHKFGKKPSPPPDYKAM